MPNVHFLVEDPSAFARRDSKETPMKSVLMSMNVSSPSAAPMPSASTHLEATIAVALSDLWETHSKAATPSPPI